MDVKTVCLGMLTDGAASGYDLKKQFESSFAHFFAAGYGSIYPALSSLAENGFVTCEQIPQDGKPDRKVYAITDAGRQFLIEALKNPKPTHKLRSEFLATLCFAHLMPPEQVTTVIHNQIEECAYFMKMIADIQENCCADWEPGKRFVAGFGLAMTTTMKDYVETNRHLLESAEPALSALDHRQSK